MPETCKKSTKVSVILKDLEKIALDLHGLTLVLIEGLEHLHSSLQSINKTLDDEVQARKWEEK